MSNTFWILVCLLSFCLGGCVSSFFLLRKEWLLKKWEQQLLDWGDHLYKQEQALRKWEGAFRDWEREASRRKTSEH